MGRLFELGSWMLLLGVGDFLVYGFGDLAFEKLRIPFGG